MVINTLSTELTYEWEQMGDTLVLNKWIEFGKKIRELGRENNISLLTDYGEKIIDNADIWAESEAGTGSSFKITLPKPDPALKK